MVATKMKGIGSGCFYGTPFSLGVTAAGIRGIGLASRSEGFGR